MATSLTTTLTLILQSTFKNVLDLTTTVDEFRLDLSDTLASGTGLDQGDQAWHDTRTLAATSETLDLAGSLTNAFGSTVTFARVKGIVIHNKATTAAYNLTVGGATNPFLLLGGATHTDPIGPDGVRVYWEPCATGKAVTAATGEDRKSVV